MATVTVEQPAMIPQNICVSISEITQNVIVTVISPDDGKNESLNYNGIGNFVECGTNFN